MRSGSTGGAGMAKMEVARVYQSQGEMSKAELIYEEARDLLSRGNRQVRLTQLKTYIADFYQATGCVS